MTNLLIKNKWLTYSSKLPNNILTNEQITNAVNDFNCNVLEYLDKDQQLLIIFKIKTDDNLIRSISYLQKINKFTDLTELFKEYWNLRIDNYQQFLIQEIIFNYFLIIEKDGLVKSKLNKPTPKIDIRPNLLRVGSTNFF